MQQEMEWNRKLLKKNSWQALFGKGVRSWFALVCVCFLFSFIGSADSSASAFITPIDELLGLAPENPGSNVELLKTYILEEEWVDSVPLLSQDIIISGINLLSQKFSWLINLLAANSAYFARNATEVWVYLLLAAAFRGIVHLFIQNALVIGKYRYVIEQRFQKQTSIRRVLAPFHRKYLFNIIRVMFRYNLQLMLWNLTIVGGFYKSYQYRMIPYLLAANPALSFRDALAMSKAMTKGYKWKMFLLDLSLWYLWLVKLIPGASILVAVPYEAAKDTEVFLLLRNHHCPKAYTNCLCEQALYAPACWEQEAEAMSISPAFCLPDIITKDEDNQKTQPYRLTDLIFLFFLFCLMGWLWEVGLHLVQEHALVNRGSMYGPWLPIYGTGGVLCILLLSRYKDKPLKTFVLIMLLAGLLEFATSWGLDYFLNASYWNYDDWFANLNGRICLAGLLAFAIGGSFAIYIAGPYLKRALLHVPAKVRNIICMILCGLFLADLICCALFGFNSGAGIGSTY